MGTLVITLVLAIIGYGFYATSIAPARQWVTKVKVDDSYTVFRGSDYADALRLCQLGFYSTSGDVREDPIFVLENNELVRQGAEAFIREGAPADELSVSDAEIDEAIKDIVSAMDEPQTEEEFDALYQTLLDYYGLSDEEFREVMATDLLQAKLSHYLENQVPEVGALVPQVHVQAILVDSEEEAVAVVERLDGGEDFATVAEEHRQGDGDLGWLPRRIMSPTFDEVAFDPDLALDTVIEPFPTDEGYYIIKVLERDEEREIEEWIRETLKDMAFGRWLEEEREEKVERNPKYDRENAEFMKNLENLYQWALDQID